MAGKRDLELERRSRGVYLINRVEEIKRDMGNERGGYFFLSDAT